jgi:uncharacterized protein
MAIYRGFSTVSSNSQKKFVLTDNDLIKQDLLNALKVKRGSRVMQPNYGCVVYEKLFENISPSDVDDIVANFKSIINNDPRISLVSIDVSPSVNDLTVTLVLQYASTNQLEQMVIIFTEDSVSF